MNKWQFAVEVVRIFADRDHPYLAFASLVLILVSCTAVLIHILKLFM